jgi:transcriptional regulator
MRAHSFATLITAPDGVPFASHVPLLLEEDGDQLFLRSYLARGNPQWQHFSRQHGGETEVLVIFQGPHALVHAYGRATVMEGEATRRIAYGLVQQHTPDMAALPADFERRLLAGVVTFEISVSRLEGKFKLSQNKPHEDRVAVQRALGSSEHEHGATLRR